MKNSKWLFLLIILLLWTVGASLVDNIQIMPGLGVISKTLVEEMLYGQLWLYAFYSVIAIIVGLGLSILLASIISMAAIRYRIVMDFFKWLSSVLHPLPGIAILPLLIIWFGVGYSSIIILILHSVLWPILTNLFTAIDTFPETLSMVGDNYEMNVFKKFVFIYLPGIMPSFIAGLKTGWARAFRAVISAEMFFGAIGSTGGLGWYIVKKRVFMDTRGIFAGLIVIVLIGIFFESVILERLENVTIERWGIKHES
jgi:NitT/TauT family transport system permease protein